jgi:hypothetical protein
MSVLYYTTALDADCGESKLVYKLIKEQYKYNFSTFINHNSQPHGQESFWKIKFLSLVVVTNTISQNAAITFIMARRIGEEYT